jgi:hypothetical protein
MGATNTDVYIKRIAPIGGVNNDEYKLGYIYAGAKAAPNDTWTVKNARSVITTCVATLDGASTVEAVTWSGLTGTLATATTTGTVTALVLYT